MTRQAKISHGTFAASSARGTLPLRKTFLHQINTPDSTTSQQYLLVAELWHKPGIRMLQRRLPSGCPRFARRL